MNPLPTLFVSHGAPTFALEPGRAGALLGALGRALPRPEAVLVVSPHWTTEGVRVATTAAPATVHDFGGFDPALRRMAYRAPGHPALAGATLEALAAAGVPAEADAGRGLDHGAWVPLTHLYPDADVPVFQVSMPARLDARGALALGAALAPLRALGVLVVGSGSLTHNLYEVSWHEPVPARYASEFVDWVRARVATGDREALARTFEDAPHALRAHPTAEHYLPLPIAVGAAGGAGPVTVLDGGIEHGVLSMESYVLGASIELEAGAPA